LPLTIISRSGAETQWFASDSPDPEEDWPAAGRVKWLQTAANIFDLIYKGDGGIKIEMAMAQRSPRPNE
jgi:hypothetical protein